MKLSDNEKNNRHRHVGRPTVNSEVGGPGELEESGRSGAYPALPDRVDWPEFQKGLVWLIGAGPGDPGLLTLHGLNALRQADVIVHDALFNRDILGFAREGVKVEYAGKRGGKPSPSQKDITLRLVRHAREGKRVARLKGGDPFVFGRGGEEALALVRAGIPIRMTPGITAGIAGLAYAGVPATHRDTNQSVTFITGHDRWGVAPNAVDWVGVAKGSQLIVLYMAITNLAEITKPLIRGGRPSSEPVLVVQNATLANQRILETTLEGAAADVERAGIGSPAIICIGENVRFRMAIDWMAQLEGAAPRTLDPLASDSNFRWGESE
ncbi:MAG: uroporphyrinogen-III C-methyltransferase [Rhodobacteraceae bacterium]|nr:uroporphyrinogen-III C-methyltransferase [Paracoccaceae bacterium]